jgi:hypothetical protein
MNPFTDWHETHYYREPTTDYRLAVEDNWYVLYDETLREIKRFRHRDDVLEYFSP